MKMKTIAIGFAGHVIGLYACTNSKAEGNAGPLGIEVSTTKIVTPRGASGYKLRNSVLHKMQIRTGVRGDTVICTFEKPQQCKRNQKKIVLSEN